MRLRLVLLPLAFAIARCASPPVAVDASDSGMALDAITHDAPISNDVTDADASTVTDASDATDAGGSTTTLRVHYPAGSHTISIRGSATPWNWDTGQAATSGAEDTWTFTTNQITAPTEWKPLLDDTTWSRGPNYHVNPGQTVDVYPHFMATQGQVIRFIATFHSTLLNNDRTVWAYLPPTYGENTRATFPVVYMHDGQNLFDATLAFGGVEWQVDEAIDTAAETGAFPEIVVIAPENTAARIDEYTPTRDATVGAGGQGDLYLRMLVEEIKPQVDAMLRVRHDAAGTAISGSSLGGLISAYAGLHYANTFGLVAALSPSTWWDNTMIIGDVAAHGRDMPHTLRVYVDSGDSGNSNDDVTNTSMLAATYESVGYVEGMDLHHVVQAGASHNETYWAQRFPGAMQFLFGARSP